MTIDRYLLPLFAAEGEAGAAAAPAPSEGGTMPSEADRLAQGTATGAEARPAHLWSFGDSRPEWVPEKFVSDAKDVDLSKVFQSYADLEKKMSTRNDHLRTEIVNELRAGVPEAYDTNPTQLPEGFEFQADENDPLFTTAVEVAKEAGLSQEQFSKLIDAYVGSMAGLLPDHAEEIGKLGENGTARLEAASNWIRGNIPQGIAEWFSGIADTAEAVEMIEWIQGQTGEPSQNGGPAASGAGAQAAVGEEELRSMMQDPRYYDPGRRDMNFVRQVEQGWKRLYG